MTTEKTIVRYNLSPKQNKVAGKFVSSLEKIRTEANLQEAKYKAAKAEYEGKLAELRQATEDSNMFLEYVIEEYELPAVKDHYRLELIGEGAYALFGEALEATQPDEPADTGKKGKRNKKVVPLPVPAPEPTLAESQGDN